MKCSQLFPALALALCAGAAAQGQIVISQIYGGGGNSGAVLTNDFIELFNPSPTTPFVVPAGGWSVQYLNVTATTTWTGKTDIPAGTVFPPGRYFLIQEAAGAGGTTALPTPDLIGNIPMGGTGGKVAIVSNQTLLSEAAFSAAPPAGTGPTIIDMVGYGAANRYEGSGPAPAPSNTTSIFRGNNGCADSNNNSADFFVSVGGAGAILPRNSASAFWDCSGGPVPTSDLQVSVVNNTGTCVQNGNFAANYTFTVTNGGPDSASNVSATLTSVSGVTPTVNVSSGTYLNGTWTIGTLANGASATLTYSAAITSPAAVRATLNATTTTVDSSLANNSATASNSSPDTSTAKAVFRSATVDTTIGDPTQTTANIGSTGFQFAGKQFAFGRIFFSPNGHRWAMVSEMANFLDSNSILIVGNDDNYFIALQELPYAGGTDLGGGVKLFSSTTQAANCFDRALAIDDAGNIAFSCQAVSSGTQTAASRAVVRGAPGANFGDPYSWTVVAYEGDAVPAAVNTAIGGSNRQWDTQMYVAGINGTDVSFYAHLRAGTPALLNNADEVLVTSNGSSVLATESVTIPTGTTYPFMGTTATTNGQDKAFDQNTDSSFATRGYKRNVAGTHWSVDAAIGRASTPTPAPTTADQVLVVDGQVVLKEGDLLPGFSGADTIAAANANNNLTFANSLNEDGTWFAYGVNAPVAPATRGTAWLVKGTGAAVTVLAKSGDPIIPAATETWSNVVSAQTFLGVAGRGNDLVYWGLTSNADTSRDAVVVWKNGAQAQVVLREGDPIDIGTPGFPNIVYCSSFIDSNRAAIDANRNLWIITQTRNSQWPCTLAAADTLGQVLLKIALPAVSVACPTLASQSGNQTIACNGTANYSVTLADAGAATYRWRRNGVDLNNGPLVIASGATVTISGATSANLSIAGVRNGNNGDSYDCVITTNTPSCPLTFSSAARSLTVLPVCKCNPADVAGLGGVPGADGQLTADDIVYFLNRFFANDTSVADLVGLGGNPVLDGAVTVDDLVYFLDQFFRPCNP